MESIQSFQSRPLARIPVDFQPDAELLFRKEMQKLADENSISTKVREEFEAMYAIIVRFRQALTSSPKFDQRDIFDKERRYNNLIRFIEKNPQDLATIRSVFDSLVAEENELKYQRYYSILTTLPMPAEVANCVFSLQSALNCCYAALKLCSGTDNV